MSVKTTLFAVLFLLLGPGLLPALAAGPVEPDADGNGVDDLLDRWSRGNLSWQELRAVAAAPALAAAEKAADSPPGATQLRSGPWSEGLVRILVLGADRAGTKARQRAAQSGRTVLVHDLQLFGGVQVMALDEAALAAYLAGPTGGKVWLDRDGIPALALSRSMVGADQLAASSWHLGADWSATVAILDSGCDTAHGDLGDYAQDNVDGPAPAVGDASDWYAADNGWPLFPGYRVVGWQDVTDDFPLAQGPWDYHYHGTALASVVAGSGAVDSAYRGLNPGGRLTVVKFYDFDGVWHAWAGDFLAACAWVVENHETYRIRSVLAAVNWSEDLGISEAMAALVDVGIVPVVAMGNFGEDAAGPGYPARLIDVLTVGSVAPDGAVSAFSGRGLDGQPKPDLLAPGGQITCADNEPDDSYSPRQGTSLAAAHVAGAVFLLDEALADNGLRLPGDRVSAQLRMTLLKATAARIDRAEDPAGGTFLLPAHDAPDQTRGWGLLRADAAVRAALVALVPGQDQLDTLSADLVRPVSARRLALSPGIRYLVEAVPQAGLDVALEIMEPGSLAAAPFGSDLLRANDQGAGLGESTQFTAAQDGWVFLVVRRVSGGGSVTLRVSESDELPATAVAVQLPGILSAPANAGQLVGSVGPTIVVPSRVAVDNVARSVNVVDSRGVALPGWPVFVFPQASAQGGLSQPVVWDLDGSPGDEIVLSSDFGSVYFFNRLGAWVRQDLGFNVPLTTPVGVVEPDGERRLVVVDYGGTLRSWSWGPVLQVTQPLGYSQPLDPAVGHLVAGDSEQLVVAFASGMVLATDTQGLPLPGWPVDLGVTLETAPVLCDVDEDGLHDVILADLDRPSGMLRFFVLKGDGSPGPGNAVVVPAPAGGKWLRISEPAVAGRYGTGDLRVSVSGLMDNGLSGSRARWHLGLGSVLATGQPWSEILAGFTVAATTSQGVLTLQSALLPSPLAYDFTGGTATEEAFVFGFQWTELLYGLTSINGAAAGWLQPFSADRPLDNRTTLRNGGESGLGLAAAGSLLVPLDGGVSLQGRILDDYLTLVPVLDGHQVAPGWTSARGDQRNTAAFPLASSLTPAPSPPVVSRGLVVFPNPGSGRFRFRLGAGALDQPAEVLIYDLRGRRLRALRASAGAELPGWDGCDQRGRPVAAGTYLAVARQGAHRSTTRFVVTR